MLPQIDPYLGMLEVLKNAGVEPTSRYRHTLKSVIELTDLAAGSPASIALTFPLSQIGTPLSIEQRLEAGCLFSAVKHALVFAKVKVDTAGAPIWGSAVWHVLPFVTGAPFDTAAAPNDLNESEQLAQLAQGILSYHAGNLTIDEMIDTGVVVEDMTTLPTYFHIDGDNDDNKAIFTLPTNIITDELGGLATDAGKTKNYVMLCVDGWLSKGLCNPDDVKAQLFQAPPKCGCADDCNCSGSSTTTTTIHPFGLVV